MNGRNDNFRVRAFKLLFEYLRRGIAVRRTLFKAVVFLHRLIVQIFPIHDEKHLIDIIELRGKLCSFEGGQRFATARRMPDVSASRNRTVLFIIV